MMETAEVESCSCVAKKRKNWLATWSRPLLAGGALVGILALVDQAIFSATSFLTTILIGRAGAKDELGAYSLGFTIVLAILCIQESLISLPYIVYGNRLEGQARARYAGSVLIHFGLLSALASTVLAVLAMILSQGIGPSRLPPVLWALAAVIPFILLRQFARRFAFAHFRIVRALMLDLFVSVLQIGGLWYLAAQHRLSAVAAYIIVGLACAAGAMAWLTLTRSEFLFANKDVARTWRQNWSFGRWIYASETTSVFHAYSMHWLLALVLNTAATGVLAACETVAALANPVMMGIGNVLTPWSAQAFARGGPSEVRAMIRKATLLLGALMLAFCAVLAVWGDRIVILLFGLNFSDSRYIVMTLGLSGLAVAVGVPSAEGLRAMERPQVNLVAGLMGLLVALTVASILVSPWKVEGVACGLLAGTIVSTTVRCTVAYRLTLQPRRSNWADQGESSSGIALDASCNPVIVCEQPHPERPMPGPCPGGPRTRADELAVGRDMEP